MAARDRINAPGKALNANHPPYPVGCVSPAQGGVLEAVLLSGGVEGKAGSGGGQGGQGIFRRPHTHHGHAGLRYWVHDGEGKSGGGGSRGGGR